LSEKIAGGLKMTVILGLIFFGIVIGSGIKRNRKALFVSHVPLSKIDAKFVALRLK